MAADRAGDYGGEHDMRKGDKLEKPKDKKGTLLKLGAYCARYWAGFLCAAFMSLFANLLSLTGPLLSGKAVDAIQTETGGWIFPRFSITQGG